MKRRLFYMVAVTVFVVTFAACTADTTTIPSGIRLNYYSAIMMPGESFTLTAMILPDEAVIKTLSWSSTDTSVAVVNDGVVTAIAEGEAFITVTTNSGQKSASCKLTILYPVSRVTLDQTLSVLSVGKSVELSATVLPLDAPDRSVKWESSNPEVAEVNNDGTVIAKAAGIANITVITDVGYRTATCVVRVASENHISMIWQPIENARILIAGSGTVDIDWGDGSAIETKMLTAEGSYCKHIYSEMLSYAVIINSSNNITRLDCSFSRLTSLDVSNNTNLTELHCSGNRLTSLDVSANTALTELNCLGNQLTNLNVSANTVLTTLNCNNNQLTSLDVNSNALTTLNCFGNQLTSLDVNSNALTTFNCSNNQLTSLDVNSNVLTTLNCNNNQLTSLDVSSNVLTTLNCNNNQLTNLDVNSNVLTTLNCDNNQLMSLDVSSNVLTTLNCNNNQLTSLDVNSNVLTTLNCSDNQLTSLDVSSNALTTLNCNNNQLISLDVNSNALTTLNCSNNKLTRLDVSSKALISLNCSNNQLTDLYVGSGDGVLTILNCQYNQLSADALNNLFGMLLRGGAITFFISWGGWSSSFTLMGVIYIYGNQGTNTCNPNIANNKGWTVFLEPPSPPYNI